MQLNEHNENTYQTLKDNECNEYEPFLNTF